MKLFFVYATAILLSAAAAQADEQDAVELLPICHMEIVSNHETLSELCGLMSLAQYACENSHSTETHMSPACESAVMTDDVFWQAVNEAALKGMTEFTNQ